MLTIRQIMRSHPDDQTSWWLAEALRSVGWLLSGPATADLDVLL
ncbi:MAG: hypothetical protein WAO58_06660 [Fimbriimonadaceae bacterium]